MKITHHLIYSSRKTNGQHSLRDSQTEDGSAAAAPTTTSRVEKHARGATKNLMLIAILLEDHNTYSDQTRRSRLNKI